MLEPNSNLSGKKTGLIGLYNWIIWGITVLAHPNPQTSIIFGVSFFFCVGFIYNRFFSCVVVICFLNVPGLISYYQEQDQESFSVRAR